MIIKNAKYVTSAVKESDFLTDFPEICFVGRSNVGKSSLINMLVGSKGLAKSSSTPGLTKMVNYFLINNELYFVDLPGYGYSKTGKKHTELWSTLLENYLLSSENLKMVFMLVHNIPHKVIATKADKIAKSKIFNARNEIAKALSLGVADVLAVSNLGYGKENVLDIVENIIK